ncbi:MAG: hypothetical protein K0R62_5240 [Nonomuraea muscovyensis]|nr:hypothetical protein [Nonomuraea muscovyensis]
MNVRPLLAAAALAAALTGCGGPAARDAGVVSAGDATGSAAAPSSGASSPVPSAIVDRREAQLKFAQCMREHGVDMDDPDPDGAIRIKARKGQEKAVDEAQKACEHFMEGAVGGPKGKPDKEALDRAVKLAQCMREHGIDVADPGSDGRIRLRVKPGTPEEKVKAAQQACRELGPGGGAS